MSWHSGLQLQVVHGPSLGETYPLTEEKMSIGRARAPGVKAPGWVLLQDRAVSRQHATLLWDNAREHYILKHLSETNYTWLNGEPCEDSPLKLGDHLKMGESTLQLQQCTEEPAAEEPVGPSRFEARPQSVFAPTARPAEAGRTAVIKLGGGHLLRVLNGPDADEEFELCGLNLTIGRGNLQPEPSEADPNPIPFEPSIELSGPDFLPNHFILRWRENDQAFNLWKNPQAQPVLVIRHSDGLRREGWLTTETAILRAGDLLRVGEVEMVVEKRVEGAAKRLQL